MAEGYKLATDRLGRRNTHTAAPPRNRPGKGTSVSDMEFSEEAEGKEISFRLRAGVWVSSRDRLMARIYSVAHKGIVHSIDSKQNQRFFPPSQLATFWQMSRSGTFLIVSGVLGGGVGDSEQIFRRKITDCQMLPIKAKDTRGLNNLLS